MDSILRELLDELEVTYTLMGCNVKKIQHQETIVLTISKSESKTFNFIYVEEQDYFYVTDKNGNILGHGNASGVDSIREKILKLV